MTPKEVIQSFIDADMEKVSKLIEENPQRIPIPVIADFLEMKQESARAAVECGAFGFAWRKDGKLNKGYCVPTAQFVRWYLNVCGLEGVYRNG